MKKEGQEKREAGHEMKKEGQEKSGAGQKQRERKGRKRVRQDMK